jgi:hypothetical protein
MALLYKKAARKMLMKMRPEGGGNLATKLLGGDAEMTSLSLAIPALAQASSIS